MPFMMRILIILFCSSLFCSTHVDAASCTTLLPLTKQLTTLPVPAHHAQCLKEAITALDSPESTLSKELASYPFILQEAVKDLMQRHLGNKSPAFKDVKTYQLATLVKNFMIDHFPLPKLPAALAALKQKAPGSPTLHAIPATHTVKSTVMLLCAKPWDADLEMRWGRFLGALEALPPTDPASVETSYKTLLSLIEKYAPDAYKRLRSTPSFFQHVIKKIYQLKEAIEMDKPLTAKSLYALITGLQKYRWINTPIAQGQAQALAICASTTAHPETCQQVFKETALALNVSSALQSFAEDITLIRCHIGQAT